MWTSYGYPAEDQLTCSNENSIVVYDDEWVGTMVEIICGKYSRTNFEDLDCGPGPHFPSEIEELFNKAAI